MLQKENCSEGIENILWKLSQFYKIYLNRILHIWDSNKMVF